MSNKEFAINHRMTLQHEKSALRKKILNSRESMKIEEVIGKSKIIIDTLMNLEAWHKSNVIMSYVNFKNEVETLDFIRKSLLHVKRIAVPLVAEIINKDDNKEIDGLYLKKIKKRIIPCEIKNLDIELERGSFGILEPKQEYRREIDIEEIDLVVVPGIAFDTNKNRLGFGAGFYDTFLKHITEKCFTIGIAFEAQVIEKVPVEAHDMPLDIIITEKRVIS